MKLALRVLGAVLGVVIVGLGIGALLPRDHRTARAIDLPQPPDSVWRAVRDFSGVPAWWSDMRAAERLPDSAGREMWRQDVDGFPLTLTIEDERPPALLVTRVVVPEDAAFGGRWRYTLGAAPGGTRVVVTEDGWIANPLYRLMARVAGLEATIDSYLRALARRFGAAAEPVPA